MNRPVLSAALFGCNIRRVIFNVFAGNAVLAPVNHSVEYNWLREAIPFLQQESRSAMPGVDALCSQICATFFTLAVREWIAQVNTEKNILSLLLHPRLGAVIQQMLEMPDTPRPSNRWPASLTCPGQVLPSFSVMFPEPRRWLY